MNVRMNEQLNWTGFACCRCDHPDCIKTCGKSLIPRSEALKPKEYQCIWSIPMGFLRDSSWFGAEWTCVWMNNWNKVCMSQVWPSRDPSDSSDSFEMYSPDSSLLPHFSNCFEIYSPTPFYSPTHHIPLGNIPKFNFTPQLTKVLRSLLPNSMLLPTLQTPLKTNH